MNLRRHQQGDTIVEVLVALIIASAVLVGAFSISNLSQKQIRMAQERTEAQKIAEGAVESLNGMYANDQNIANRTGANDTTLAPFCPSAGTFTAVITKSYEDNPTTCLGGFNGYYHTAITSVSPGSTTFRVLVSWPGLNGREERLEIYYRVKDPDAL